VWNAATDDPISAGDVNRAADVVARELDDGFFAARVARIPPSELRYVQALAGLGPGPHRSRHVAGAMGLTTPAVGAFRDRLIGEGILFAPAFGQVQFALPLLDDYVRRRL
ncbi:MAG: ATP-binding protein, partial [Acidimicrobiales bacterium]